MATDSFSHPVFMRLAGELSLDAVHAGDRLFVVEAMFVAVLRDDAPTRARVTGAFDRAADRAWAQAASRDELHLALLDLRRWDAALDELLWQKSLDARGLLSRLPSERLGALQAVVGRFAERDRREFLEGAARHLAGSGDRAALTLLVRSLYDFVRLPELEPLLLLLDRSRPDEGRLMEFARVRIGMILAEDPSQKKTLARLAAHVGA